MPQGQQEEQTCEPWFHLQMIGLTRRGRGVRHGKRCASAVVDGESPGTSARISRLSHLLHKNVNNTIIMARFLSCFVAVVLVLGVVACSVPAAVQATVGGLRDAGATRTVSLSAADAAAPGARGSVSQAGLTYIKSVVLTLIENKFSTVTLPDLNFDKGEAFVLCCLGFVCVAVPAHPLRVGPCQTRSRAPSLT